MQHGDGVRIKSLNLASVANHTRVQHGGVVGGGGQEGACRGGVVVPTIVGVQTQKCALRLRIMNVSESFSYRSYPGHGLHTSKVRICVRQGILHLGVTTELCEAIVTLLLVTMRPAPGQVELNHGVRVVVKDFLGEYIEVGDTILAYNLGRLSWPLALFLKNHCVPLSGPYFAQSLIR